MSQETAPPRDETPMKPLATLLLALAAFLPVVTLGTVAAQDQATRSVRVEFKPGADSAEITGRITGRESVLYKLNARKGQFLSLSLRPDNQSADFNLYVPGKGPGDEAMFNSAVGGREYTGQLYLDGDHTVSVFLNRAAARRGETANFDIVFRVTSEPPSGPPAADGPDSARPATPSNDREAAWSRVEMETRPHAPLLERQGTLGPGFAKAPPATLALLVLDPSLTGIVTTVGAAYDSMETPSEATVTVTEGGILDDDLLGVRHVVSLARNSNGEWRIVGLQRGELRRRHLR